MTIRTDEAQRGFTLIELMISLVLFSFAVAGVLSVAVSMTQAYREQRQVINAEASVRAPLDFLSDVLRQASPGVSDPNKMQDWQTCVTGAITVTNSKTAPDELDVFYATGGIVTSLATNPFTASSTSIAVTDASQLSAGDYVIVTDLSYGMLVKISSISGNTLNIASKCTNSSLLTSFPPTGLATGNYPIGSLIVRAQHAHFKIQTVNGAPTLTMDPDGDAANGGGLDDYEPLAENIEDMQIAIGIDNDSSGGITEDGSSTDEWWYNNSSDGSLPASYKIRAVRVTLTARTSSALFGNKLSFYKRPAAEDRTAGAFDNYRRRVLRSMVDLRNITGSP